MNVVSLEDESESNQGLAGGAIALSWFEAWLADIYAGGWLGFAAARIALCRAGLLINRKITIDKTAMLGQDWTHEKHPTNLLPAAA
jgi:hypothetical protein